MMRKKKGSVLVTTIIIFGALLTVGMALLSMSLGDYKMRQSENKRIKNLYGSESGVDVAYDIIVRDFDSAAQFGAFRAKQLEADVNANADSPYKSSYKILQAELKIALEDPNTTPQEKAIIRKEKTDLMEILKNKEFRRSFKIFLYVPTIVETPNREERNQSFGYSIPNMLKYSLEGKKSAGNNRAYIKGLKEKNRELTSNITAYNDFEWDDIDLVPGDTNSEPEITVDIKVDDDYSTNDDNVDKYYEIRVNSTFKTIGANTKINGQNKRTVQAIYKLKIPEYKDVVFGETPVKEYKPYKDKGITIGGNMTVGEEALNKEFNLTVDGNIYVEGSSEGITLGDKYKGGISLNNVNDVNFTKNVVTEKTFNIRSNVDNANVTENLYAANVYAGEITDNSECKDSKLTVAKDMVLNNDLTLNAYNTEIETDNFYGINDETTPSSDDNKTGKITNSSSIIVNKYKKTGINPSSIRIKQNAWIMGVAYIDTNKGYATGESVGVKGNYNAYSEHVDNDNMNNTDDGIDKNLGFDAFNEQDSPLYLVNGSVLNKMDHFYDYWNGKTGVDAADPGGVIFDNPDSDHLFTAGSIVCKLTDGSTKVEKGFGSIEQLNTNSLSKQREYASRVYDMNMSESNSASNTDLDNLYNSDLKRKHVSELMRFPSTNENDKFKDGTAKQIGNVKNGFGIFNPNAGNDIVINGVESGGEIDVNGIESGTITIDVPKGKTLNAFIATAGNVKISGEVKIKGNIIAVGNLDIKNKGNKTITYDDSLAKSLQINDEGIEMFEQVFGSGDVSLDSVPNNVEIVVQYDLAKYLKNLLWKLVK